MTPAQVATVIAAWSAVLLVLVGAVGAIAVQVLRNVRDIRAAWERLRLHERALNGAVEAARKDGVP